MSFWTVNVQGFPTVLVISRGQALTTKEPFASCGDKVLSLKCWLSWAGGGKINGHQPRGKSSSRGPWWEKQFPSEREKTHTSALPFTPWPDILWNMSESHAVVLLQIYISIQQRLNQDQLITHSIVLILTAVIHPFQRGSIVFSSITYAFYLK